jgi:signal transduction histidine kinase
LKRVQNKEWFSNNQNIGYIYLDSETSGPLVEKTNREGFIHNSAYENLIVVIEYILTQFKSERQSDREKWLNFNRKGTLNDSFEDKITGFKALIAATNLDQENKTKLLLEASKIEDQYEEDRNNLLIPAGVGMTASFAMHEIEKLVPRMQESVKQKPVNTFKIASEVDELKDYVDGILSVLKKGGNKQISLLESINQALTNYGSRLRGRNITVHVEQDPLIEYIVCDKRLLITILMNVIDNSVYWLSTVYMEEKGIYIQTNIVEKGISILIVDNGPGFKERPEDIVRPFYSRKQAGIGIGMYLVDTVMIQYGKLNIIYDQDYLRTKGVPEVYTGAAIELIFNKLQQ